MFKQAIEIPSVHNRGETHRVAELLADQFRAAGIPDADIHIMPYEALPGDQTVALIVRWRSPHATKKPMLVLGHMDVVEAKREDWKYDPFVFREEGGYFYGRGTSDMKNGDVATTMAAVKLMGEGFKPDRDIIFFYSGDEETRGSRRDARLDQMAQPHRRRVRAQRGRRLRLLRPQFQPLGCGISTAEKTFQTYFFTTHNPGGHSSRPRPDNAIYELTDALKALQNHRFQPMMNDASRGYFEERARQEGNSPLGQQIRAWLANPNDGAAADAIEANPLEVGLTRTRCVATMLQGGPRRQRFAAKRAGDGQLPDHARSPAQGRAGRAAAACRAQGRGHAGSQLYRAFRRRPRRCGPKCSSAVTKAIQHFHGPDMHVFPMMSDRRQRRQLLPRPGNPGLRRRWKLGHFARRRTRARPRRAPAGPRDVRRRFVLGDDLQVAGGLMFPGESRMMRGPRRA